MKKIYVKFICLIISICMLIPITACDKKETGDNNENVETPKVRESVVVYDGTHDVEEVETDSYFIYNASSDYTLVTPKNPNKYELTAQKEFDCLFEKATGFTLNKVTDENLTHDDLNKYISLGNTTLLDTADIEIDYAKLEKEGAQIVTKGSTTFLFGGTTNGVIFSVYDFMKSYFNYETYYYDCLEIDTGVTETRFLELNVLDIPDVPMRSRSFYDLSKKTDDYDESMFQTRMRVTSSRDRLPIHKEYTKSSPNSLSSSHNSEYYLPRSIYYAEHDKWFSDNGDQLCYTAHGDAEEYELMVQECAKKVEFSLETYSKDDYPEYNVVALNIMDNRQICTCPSCMDNFKKYDNCNSASVVMFMNDLAEKVDAWMALEENEEYRRDLKYIFFAYLDLEPCPARYNESTKKYEPIDENVKLNDNVGVYLALLDSFEYQVSVYADINKKGRQIVEAWADMTDYIWYWLYSARYEQSEYYYDSLNFFAEGYKYIISNNAKQLFIEGENYHSSISTAFVTLRLYLDAKCSWDSSLSINDLTKNWFNAMFKEAAPEMMSVFEDVRLYVNNMINANNLIKLRSNLSVDVYNAKYWNYLTTLDWLNRMDNAKLIIEKKYKDDDVTRNRICRYIEKEAFSPALMLIHLFPEKIDDNYRKELANRIENDLEIFEARKGNGKSYNMISGLLENI